MYYSIASQEENGRDEKADFNKGWWTDEFARYKANHINLARVWIHGSGEMSPDIDESGHVSGVSDLSWQHMDHLFAVSKANGVCILLALFSFDVTKNTYPTYERWITFLRSPAYIQSYIDNVLIPQQAPGQVGQTTFSSTVDELRVRNLNITKG